MSRKRQAVLTVCLLLFVGGCYLLVLTQIPRFQKIPVTSSIDLNTDDDNSDQRDRIQIKKLNLEVPYFTGDASSLEKGSWWRFPERGNPKKGGNFILSAHRFFLGLTPQGTRARSPFYRLNELDPGDEIRVYYKKQWYDYKVTKNYSVKPNAVEIEETTKKAKMTLYTCSLAGSADGRVVIDAKPVDKPETDQPSENRPTNGSPIL